MKLVVRNFFKAFLQNIFLPIIYFMFCYQKIDNNLVIFADAKSNGINYSIFSIYKAVKKRNYNIKIHNVNYSELNFLEKIKYIMRFMHDYAKAKVVFINDYFLPVASCNKREKTIVVQLWHASGVLKKFGYDVAEDLGNGFSSLCPTKNWNYVTVSSKYCIPFFQKAFRLYGDQVVDTGSSRTDIFFDSNFQEICKKEFYETYPEYIGKKIILWAPTFRGDVTNYDVEGIEEIKRLMKQLPEDYKVIIKLHPRIKNNGDIEQCDFDTDRLYAVTDLLITDFSSIIFDFILLKKKIIFFSTDYDYYLAQRGLYIDIEKNFNIPVIKSVDNLCKAVIETMGKELDKHDYEKYIKLFLDKCDGKASQRILNLIDQD